MRATEFLTEDANVVAVQPRQLSAEKLSKLSDFIAQGGEVSAANAHAGVQRAQLLSYATDEQGRVIAITVLKTPLDTYRTKVFASAGVANLARQYPCEKGYSYTDPNYRRQGLNTAVSQKLLASTNSKIFATTRSDNQASKNNLAAQGFTQLGRAWPSTRGDYSLELWVGN